MHLYMRMGSSRTISFTLMMMYGLHSGLCNIGISNDRWYGDRHRFSGYVTVIRLAVIHPRRAAADEIRKKKMREKTKQNVNGRSREMKMQILIIRKLAIVSRSRCTLIWLRRQTAFSLFRWGSNFPSYYYYYVYRKIVFLFDRKGFFFLFDFARSVRLLMVHWCWRGRTRRYKKISTGR